MRIDDDHCGALLLLSWVVTMRWSTFVWEQLLTR